MEGKRKLFTQTVSHGHPCPPTLRKVVKLPNIRIPPDKEQFPRNVAKLMDHGLLIRNSLSELGISPSPRGILLAFPATFRKP